MNTKDMLLRRFLPRVEFDSYEDFMENYRVNIPDGFNFAYDVVDAWAEIDPDKKALVWCDDHGREQILTFDDIARRSAQTAHFLLGLGVRKGDMVMNILRQRYEYWIVAMALCRIGAICIPGSVQMTAKDIVYRANTAGIKAIVCVDDDFVAGQLALAQKDCPTVRHYITVGEERRQAAELDWLHLNAEIEKYPERFPQPAGDAAASNEDTMLIYFTSGTTGMPKMVRHTFNHPLGHIVTAKYWQRVQDGKLHMSVADTAWAKFGWGKIYGQWICGAVVFAYDWDKFVPALLLEKLAHYGITTFCASPTHIRFMLLEDLSRYDLSAIESCGNAGEPLNPEVYNQWLAKTGLKLTEGFGQTESSVLIANFPWFPPKPGSMGKPAPLYDIDIVDAQGNSCGDGEEGEIVVKGISTQPQWPTGLFMEYYKDDEMTAEVMRGGQYNTRDVAWRDSDGYLWFVGRNDDVIKCSGYRIGPFEVESALAEHPAVVECAVTAVPDEIRGQVVKATVVLKPGTAPADGAAKDALVKELQEHVKRVTAPYKYPRIIEFVAELPKTIGGKIKRAEIRSGDYAAKGGKP